MPSNPILITGAKGRIGRALLRHWRDRDCAALDRDDGDLTSYDAGWTDRFAGVETVVHLAADPDPDPSSPFESAAAANIQATLNVIRAFSEQGVRRLVHASSVWAEYEAWQLSPRMTW